MKWEVAFEVEDQLKLAELLMDIKFKPIRIVQLDDIEEVKINMPKNSFKRNITTHRVGARACILLFMARKADQSFSKEQIFEELNRMGWTSSGTHSSTFSTMQKMNIIIRLNNGRFKLTELGRNMAIAYKETGHIRNSNSVKQISKTSKNPKGFWSKYSPEERSLIMKERAKKALITKGLLPRI